MDLIDSLLQIGCHFGHRRDDALDDDQRGCLLLVAAVLIVLVSTCLAYREIVYLCCGRETEATVLRTYDTPGGDPGTTVDFEFPDAATGGTRRQSAHMPRGWSAPVGPLMVEYVPGSDTYARVAGHRQDWSLWVFGASLTAVIAYIGWLIREANVPIRKRRRC